MVKNMGVRVFNGDVLILSATTTDATGSIVLRGRVLTDEQEMVEFENLMTFSGTGAQTEKVLTLRQGWLIGFAVTRASGTFTEGEVMAAVHVGRNVGANQQKLVCLASGAVMDIRSLGLGAYPSQTADVRSTVNVPTVVSVTNPAAGADFSQTVPAGQQWLLVSVCAHYAADATVSTRQVVLIVDDGTFHLTRARVGTGITASQEAYLTGLPSLPSASSAAGTVITQCTYIAESRLVAGCRIRSETNNIQAGDQWNQIRINALVTTV